MEPYCPIWPPPTDRLAAKVCSKQRLDAQVGKENILGGIKMFSVLCHASKLVCCQYIRCREVSFSQ